MPRLTGLTGLTASLYFVLPFSPVATKLENPVNGVNVVKLNGLRWLIDGLRKDAYAETVLTDYWEHNSQSDIVSFLCVPVFLRVF